MGLLDRTEGSVRFEGDEIRGEAPYRINRRGLGWVPEDRRVFTDLTVLENLQMGLATRPRGTPPMPRAASRLMPRAASRVRKRSAVMTCRMPALARAAQGSAMIARSIRRRPPRVEGGGGGAIGPDQRTARAKVRRW